MGVPLWVRAACWGNRVYGMVVLVNGARVSYYPFFVWGGFWGWILGTLFMVHMPALD